MRDVNPISLHPLTPDDQPWVAGFLQAHWGSNLIVTRRKVHPADRLPGFRAMQGGSLAGLLTYRIEARECEVISLDSLVENQGVGTALLNEVREAARRKDCLRVWLVTTNDNTPALRFYQKRGFRLAALYPGAIAYSRKLKPQIPELGLDGIPIRDELVLEIEP